MHSVLPNKQKDTTLNTQLEIQLQLLKTPIRLSRFDLLFIIRLSRRMRQCNEKWIVLQGTLRVVRRLALKRILFMTHPVLNWLRDQHCLSRCILRLCDVIPSSGDTGEVISHSLAFSDVPRSRSSSFTKMYSCNGIKCMPALQSNLNFSSVIT